MTSFESAPTPQSPVEGRTHLLETRSYKEAESVVDRLSDAGFPVEHVRIVGTGIRSVEQVTGRMTKGKAALAGAASGAWFGLFLGLFFGLFSISGNWFGLLVFGLAIGALWGAVFGYVGHLATGGRRDFSSVRALEAERYIVEVDGGYSLQAREILGH
ncbi:hypothetical protein JL107_16970 [Nakamurella flavida]|uniref:General stress protein 17M-like domain-containing protein n=1 Tax=Nakamurella flavida TaxID=363630 RepID=A0A939C7G3_9ACTN|nr:general stress protein [Nakamurella flavida]MBM9478142.1 hypothetical protein [Nakamurella flavida]MDP9778636.1 hypothetical protein [Nakamurella flavida]